MLYVDLGSLKTILEIPECQKEEDKRLLVYAEWASKWLEELCNRPGFSYKQRIEYHDGKGTPNLILRHRPVYTTDLAVYLDDNGNFGASSGSFINSDSLLVYGTDYCLRIDQEDGTSRSGIIYRINGLWPKLRRRQGGYLSPFNTDNLGSIKVVYNAGYTVDNCHPMLRMAANTLVAKMRNYYPLALEIAGEGYEDRALSYVLNQRDYLLTTVKDMVIPVMRNWKF